MNSKDIGPADSKNSFVQFEDDKFRLIVEGIKDYAIFMLDPEGYVSTWNQGAKLIKGYEPSEIIGKHFSQFYITADRDRQHPQKELAHAQAHGVYEEEGWRVRKDGSHFWANVVITPLHDKEGKLQGFAKVTRDLTVRMSENEKILDQIISEATSFITLLSVPDYRYIKSNSGHQKLIGRSNIIGKTVQEVEPDLESQGIIELLDEVVRTGKPFVAKEKLIHYATIGERRAKSVYLDFVYQPLRRLNGEIYAIAAQGYEVTEKVLTRRAVENERENFRNLFRQTPEMVCITAGPEHVFEFVNEAHIKVLGFDATGKAVRVAQPESVEVHGILDYVYRTGKTAELKEIAVTLSDRRGFFNLTYSARRNEQGEINGIMILGVEITESKLAEEALATANAKLESSALLLERTVSERTRELKESQSFLDSVIENIPNMVFVKDAKDLRFVRFNRAGEEMLGISRQELIGKNDYDFFPPAEADFFVAKDREVLSGRTVIDIAEEPIHTKHRGQRILHTRKIPIFGADGKPEYLLGIAEDITEWKEAEIERLKMAREQAAMAERKRESERAVFLGEASTILASSLDYHLTLNKLARLAVPLMADWCTVTIIKEDRSKERVAFIHRDPQKVDLINELATYYPVNADEDGGIGHVIKTGKTVFVSKVQDQQVVAAAQDPRHLEIMRSLGCASSILVPIVARGKILGAIALVSAGEERLYNENDLALAEDLGRRAGTAIDNALLYQAAQKAVKARDEFLSIASHELKTPLTTLKLQAQIRKREVDKGEYRRFKPEMLPKLLTDDEKQINRLARLIDDMLDVSRVQSGKLSLSAEEFNLGKMIGDTLLRFHDQIEASGSALSLQVEGEVLSYGDYFRIEQVFINLLTNAIKYGPGKTIAIQVWTENDHAAFSVKDQGMGIAKEDQERVFGQFERAVTSNSVSGLGLGLYISKQIIEAHSGQITLDSKLGLGSTFTVKIPYRPSMNSEITFH